MSGNPDSLNLSEALGLFSAYKAFLAYNFKKGMKRWNFFPVCRIHYSSAFAMKDFEKPYIGHTVALSGLKKPFWPKNLELSCGVSLNTSRSCEFESLHLILMESHFKIFNVLLRFRLRTIILKTWLTIETVKCTPFEMNKKKSYKWGNYKVNINLSRGKWKRIPFIHIKWI